MNRTADLRENVRDGGGGRHKQGRKKEQPDLDEFESLGLGINAPQEIPFLQIYEMIMVLQQRGITVRLTSTAVREAAAAGLISRPPAVNMERISPELERTSRSDTSSINAALTFLLNCGADIDFGPVLRDHRPDHRPSSIRCNTCFETFSNQREKDQHRQRRTCEYCDYDDSIVFSCLTKYDEHIRRGHNMSPHKRNQSHNESDAGW